MKINSAYIFAIIAVFFWSTASTAFKLGLKYFNPENLVFFSALSSLVFFLLLYIPQTKTITKKQLFFSAGLGFLNPFAYYLVLLNAYNILKAQEAQVLNYTWAVMLVLLSVPILKIKLKLVDLLSILLSFFGVIIIATNGRIMSLEFTNFFGVFLALFSSIIWAFYWLLNMKDKRNEVNKLFLSFLFGCIYLVIYLVVTKNIQSPLKIEILAPIYIGFFEMGITFWLWMKALNISDNPSKIANLIYVTPFLSLVFIFLILHEDIYFSTFIGLIFILSGNVIQKYFERKEKHGVVK